MPISSEKTQEFNRLACPACKNSITGQCNYHQNETQKDLKNKLKQATWTK